jgi:PIN domain nuclease of toxin-antitoxin system
VLIWTLEGTSGKLGRKALERIEAAGQKGRLLVSAATVWEIAMLHERRRITFARPIDDWVAAAIRQPGISYIDLSPEIAIESTRLPGLAHGDPIDRILIATTRVTGAQLVTCDGRLIDYAALRHVQVLDARV